MKKIFVLFLLFILAIPMASSKDFKNLSLEDYFYKKNVYISRIGDERVEYYNGRIVRIGDIGTGKSVTYNDD